MRNDNSRITIHMVSSLDGYIAKKDNSIDWFETSSHYENGNSGEDPEEFLKNIDCYIMGSRTFELAIKLSKSYGWAYGDKPTIVLTKRNLETDKPNIGFYSGELRELVTKLLVPKYKNIWVVGGSVVAKEFIQLKLADEIRLSILPIILGDGLLFLDQIGQEQPLNLKNCIAYQNGMVELLYKIKKSDSSI